MTLHHRFVYSLAEPLLYKCMLFGNSEENVRERGIDDSGLLCCIEYSHPITGPIHELTRR